MKQQRFFASDNSSPVHPAVLSALQDVNAGHAVSYGQDEHTEAAIEAVRAVFGGEADVFFVYNGTGANVLGIQTVTRAYNAVICTDVSHIDTDECGAPEASVGAKLLPVPTTDGKLRPDGIESHLSALGVEHHSQPSIVSITQSTELGTVYTLAEIEEICSCAHANGLFVHMDGARFANAVVALDADPAVMARGVDILSFGATKNGIMFGEAVVFLQRGLSDAFPYIRKQGMQLASKMRYISAQFSALLAGDLWLENARHANAMAARLRDGAVSIDALEIVYPVEANALFVRVPKESIPTLQSERFFYVWDAEESIVRWMTSWDTTESDVDDFIALLKRTL